MYETWVPAMGLRAYDRLEPSPQMADVMQFERLIEFLVIVLLEVS